MSRARLFASDRERRLWAWTLAVLAGIWLTLGVAPLLTGALRDRGLLTAGFALGLALVGATAAAQGLRTRPSGAEAAVALGVTAVYLLVLVRMALPEERTHLIEYGVVAAFMHEALTERTDGERRVLAALLALLGATLAGALDECIQLFLPNRVFDPQDLFFNFSAAAMAIAASVALGWARRRAGG